MSELVEGVIDCPACVGVEWPHFSVDVAHSGV